MTRSYRLTLIAISVILLLAIGRTIIGDFSFVIDHFWFTSGLLLLVLLSLIDQPHFSKDSNIFVNGVTASLSLLLVDSTERDFIFWAFFSVAIYLLISSYTLMWIRQKPLFEERATIRLISRLNREIGKPEALFSAFFLWGAYKQFGINSNEFDALLIFWAFFIVLNIPKVASSIEDFVHTATNDQLENALGKIFGVQSKNTFLAKLAPLSDRKEKCKLFDFVEFVHGSDGDHRRGLIIDNYVLNEEQWIKVLSGTEIESVFNAVPTNPSASRDVVYKMSNVPDNDLLARLVGIVTDNSRIGKLRFIYNSAIDIFEGQLLEANVSGTMVLYQIVEGVTRIDALEQRNESGAIIGEAIQLGTWNNEKLHFEQYGWVPNVNAPVLVAADIEPPKISPEEYTVGRIPDTNYPVVLNKALAMSHHMAVIGVTGTGKSVFSRNLIREHLKEENTKVICIDFTGEYAGRFGDLNPQEAIKADVAEHLFRDIDFIERELAANYNKDNDKSRAKKKAVSESVFNELKSFLEGDESLAIFELPHVENTSGVLTYTKTFFRILFHIAKTESNFGNRICLVLEEAHTIVPEWNFSGVSDKVSQPLLNSIAQIALQGRKYDVGLLVIAQRTANVSKTILTQCNTIVSFQEFDKTSSDFLANYFGEDIVKSLPKLKFRQAIAAGKAFRSSVPMIFEVPEIDEDK